MIKVAEKTIKTFGDAEKAIETLRQSRPMTRRSMSDIDPMSKARSFNSGLDAALEILRELEAGVRDFDFEEIRSDYGRHGLIVAKEVIRRLLEGEK